MEPPCSSVTHIRCSCVATRRTSLFASATWLVSPKPADKQGRGKASCCRSNGYLLRLNYCSLVPSFLPPPLSRDGDLETASTADLTAADCCNVKSLVYTGSVHLQATHSLGSGAGVSCVLCMTSCILRHSNRSTPLPLHDNTTRTAAPPSLHSRSHHRPCPSPKPPLS